MADRIGKPKTGNNPAIDLEPYTICYHSPDMVYGAQRFERGDIRILIAQGPC